MIPTSANLFGIVTPKDLPSYWETILPSTLITSRGTAGRAWIRTRRHSSLLRPLCSNGPVWGMRLGPCEDAIMYRPWAQWGRGFFGPYMCICDTMCWSIICKCFLMILRFDYICNKWFITCLENYIWFHWVNLRNQKTRALLDSILLCTVYNCLLDLWLTPSIAIFRLKFNWETETLDLFIKCKVERGSF